MLGKCKQQASWNVPHWPFKSSVVAPLQLSKSENKNVDFPCPPAPNALAHDSSGYFQDAEV